ncbi:Succinoglycan biosynthesis transport protein ExoT [Saliniradius amylolyticus]|uniref:Succinoglycan biosynthesis transport protein ExoT n=1 Tax=Saliniradius amylolyticus TaxID=2183582 RepID=A0A2S2E3R1_9ALTE|nr:oligosaccharide flippase family protein [Saliniradius amylolyticus]AWL11657.1 Succinoglycan biosynthesis transport protein ExoT [Saliniradius amylolyticus]
MPNLSFKAQVLNSLKWVAIGRIGTQLIRWLITFWVIRILTPEDYGVVAISDILFSFLTTVAGAFALSPLIQSKQLSQQQLSGYFGAILLFYLSLFALQMLTADWFAYIYDSEVVDDILRVNAWCFLLLALEAIPSAMLSRQMAFKSLSLINAGANIVAAIATLTFALNGFGFWALVYGEIVAIGLRVIALTLIHPIRFWPSLDFSQIKELGRFGGTMSLLSVVLYLFLHLDVAVGGLLLSNAQIGLFAVALQFALMPQKKILPLIRQVAFPAFSQIQHSPKLIGNYMLRAQQLSALAVLPIFWGLASVTDYIIPLVLGARWEDAILPTTLVLLIMPLRFSEELFHPAIKALGKGGVLLNNTLLSIAVMSVAIVIGSHYGAPGLAGAWLLGFPVVYFMLLRRYTHYLQFSAMGLMRSVLPFVLAGGLMLLLVHIAKIWLVKVTIINLTCLVMLGAVTYLGVLWLFCKDRLLESKRLLSQDKPKSTI